MHQGYGRIADPIRGLRVSHQTKKGGSNTLAIARSCDNGAIYFYYSKVR